MCRQQLNFVYLLAKSYEAWDALDFIPAYEYMKKLNLQIRRDKMHRKFLLMDCAEELQEQEVILCQLKEIPALTQAKRNNGFYQDENRRLAMAKIICKK